MGLFAAGALCLLAASCEPAGVRPEATPATATPLATVLPATTSPTPTPTPTVLPPTSTPPPATPTPGVLVHAVRPGDTLLGLALLYGVPMAALQLQNGMGASTVLHAGQEIAVPSPAGWEGASPFWLVHVAGEGETLTSIARAYGLSLGAIQSVNALADADRIRVGQALVLPLEGPAVAQVATPSPTPTPTPTSSPTVAPTTAPTPLPSPTAAPAAAPPPELAAWRGELARIIDEVRAAHGLPPFGHDDALAQAAQAHADDCAARGWCSHTGSDGADVKTRIVRAGYEPAGWAECWAWSRSPQHAVDMWMDEAPPDDAHRRTLLHTWLTEIGVGVAPAEWGYYFIVDFGRP